MGKTADLTVVQKTVIDTRRVASQSHKCRNVTLALKGRINTEPSSKPAGGLAQMVERSLSMREVAGSMPASSTLISCVCVHQIAGFCHVQALVIGRSIGKVVQWSGPPANLVIVGLSYSPISH